VERKRKGESPTKKEVLLSRGGGGYENPKVKKTPFLLGKKEWVPGKI